MAAASRIVLTFGSARIEHNYYVGLGRPIGFCIWCNKFFKTNAALKLRTTGHTNEQSDPGGCKMEHALSRCLPVIIINIIIITSKEIPQEHRHPTFDLIAKLRSRRLKWASQILRNEPEDSLVHQVLVAVAKHDLSTCNARRSPLMDAEQHNTVVELLALAKDRKGWAARVKQIDPTDHNTAAASSLLDANAEEWLKGAKVHDGRFKG